MTVLAGMVRLRSLMVLAMVVVLLNCPSMLIGQEGPRHRVYTTLLKPKEHPDYDRRHTKPPTWETFGNRTQFCGLRGFDVQNDRLVNVSQELERFTRTHDLGDVIWPAYPVLFAKNAADLADEIKRRNLYLFDIWGFVPGSGPGGYWQQFKLPDGVLPMLESRLGDRWLGMDVGEQDGRYVGGYAPAMYPVSAGRFEQYLNFQRHFERMCDDLGNRMSTLVSLNFGHYFLKEGVYTLIGAETAQGLPNSQVYYAFIRGAGKQYGVPWFGNASVFNRWGWKVYGSEGADGGYHFGPMWGSSLNLLKRLMYSHILYNCVFVGFESSWFDGQKLSPLGGIQQAANRWVRQHGAPGVMQTPIAVMVDFFSGWSFPRHLYTDRVYRVWGNLPYQAGDYLTDGVLDMVYPGYQDSSYFHDERGFLTPTPYGDAADCLLSDSPAWLLARYPVLVVAGELSGGAEIRDKFDAYVRGGGRLVITAGNIRKLPQGLAGVTVGDDMFRFSSGQAIELGSSKVTETQDFVLHHLKLHSEAKVIARCGAAPAAVELSMGKGRVIVLASPWGVGIGPEIVNGLRSETEKPLAKPFPLLMHVRGVLDGVFRGEMLFEAGSGLCLITCRKGPGDYTVGVLNNSLRPLPMKIVSHCGALESVQELVLDQSDKGQVGYMPKDFEKTEVGKSDAATVAGGDVRIFAVKVREQGVEEIAHAAPPPRPRGRLLPLRGVRPIKEEVLARPTFFEHFDGVVVDWRYLHEREKEALKRQAGWIARQGLRVVVDLTSGINLYPDLRLMNNLPEDYQASMAAIEDVLAKMPLLGSRDLVLALHRFPENNFTGEQSWAAFDATLKRVCGWAAEKKVTVYLRIYPNRPPDNAAGAVSFVRRVGAPNLKLAPSTVLLCGAGGQPKDVLTQLGDTLGMWMVSAPSYDISGGLVGVHGRLAEWSGTASLLGLLTSSPQVPVVFDGLYASPDEEYLDAKRVSEAR